MILSCFFLSFSQTNSAFTFSNRRQASEQFFSEQLASENHPSTSADLLSDNVHTASMPHHFHFPKSGIFPLQIPSSSRPFSVYDNVAAGLAESEDDLDDDMKLTLAPSAGGELDDDSEFEAKMEVGHQNLYAADFLA